MNYKTTTFAALAVAMLLSTPVSAADSVIEFSAEASEFSTEAGTKRVLKRIRVTSNVACPASAIMPPRLVRECRQELRHELITKINQQLNDRRFVQLAVASGLLDAS